MYSPPDPSAPWWLAGSAIAGGIVIKTLDWWLGRRVNRADENLSVTQANSESALIQSLHDRIASLEARQAQLEHRLTEEIQMRLQAQEEVMRMRLRIMQLEAALRAHHIDLPVDLFTQPLTPERAPHRDAPVARVQEAQERPNAY